MPNEFRGKPCEVRALDFTRRETPEKHGQVYVHSRRGVLQRPASVNLVWRNFSQLPVPINVVASDIRERGGAHEFIPR